MSKDYFIDKVLATTVVGSYPLVKGSGLRSSLILSIPQSRLQLPIR